MSHNWAIEINDLRFAYPDGFQALAGIHVKIARDERVALSGPNGAGKSTLLLHLNGILLSPAVSIAGTPVTEKELHSIRQKVGLVFQNPDDQLFCPSVGEDVAFGPQNMKLPAPEIQARVEASLRQVGLPGFEPKSSFHLSLGQKKRVALATVLAMQPALLALDEPTANLDPRGRREMAELLAQVGGTQVIATHDLKLIQRLCTRVLVLEQGRIVADELPAHLLADSSLLERYGLQD